MLLLPFGAPELLIPMLTPGCSTKLFLNPCDNCPFFITTVLLNFPRMGVPSGPTPFIIKGPLPPECVKSDSSNSPIEFCYFILLYYISVIKINIFL